MRFVAAFAVILLAYAGCAPRDESFAPKNGDKAKAAVEVPESLKDRIDYALKHVHEREIRSSFNFWAVFHAILGMGPDHTFLIDEASMKREKAIDYIRRGAPMKGLEFEPTANGIEVVTQAGSGIGQGHTDQFVAEMAQWGLPLDTPFKVAGKNVTFADFVRQSKSRASIAANTDPAKMDAELSWTIVIVSQYFGPDHQWKNSRGEDLTVADLAKYEMDQPVGAAACGGTHRLFGLSWAYQLHRQKGGTKTGVWKDVAAHLEKFQDQAHRYQNPDGSFSTKYVSEPGNEGGPEERIGSTGHVLEWLALSLPDDVLKKQWMQDAAGALAKMILENSSRGIDGGALYHAAHGLSLYRTRVFGAVAGDRPLAPPVPKD